MSKENTIILSFILIIIILVLGLVLPIMLLVDSNDKCSAIFVGEYKCPSFLQAYIIGVIIVSVAMGCSIVLERRYRKPQNSDSLTRQPAPRGGKE